MTVNEGFSPPPRLEWMTGAACLQYDPEMWHPGKGCTARPAQHICNTICPVRFECLYYALKSDEPLTGIWGGLTSQQRARLRGTTGHLEQVRVVEPARPWTCPDCGKTGLSRVSAHRVKAHGWRRTA